MVQNVTVMTCTVQQSEQCIRFSDEEGSRTEVSLKVAARSATLQDAITTAKSSGTEEFRLPFPYGILHTWIGALRNISHLPQDDVNVILECLLSELLQVAHAIENIHTQDYLADDQLLDRLCRKLAESMFGGDADVHSAVEVCFYRPHGQTTPPLYGVPRKQEHEFSTVRKSRRESSEERFTSKHDVAKFRSKIPARDLEILPEHLIQKVLNFISDNIEEQIALLPQRLHSLAVHGAYPSICAQGSLSLSCANWTLPTAVAVLQCFAKLSQSTHLSVCHFPRMSTTEVTDYVGAITDAVSSKPASLSMARLGPFVANKVVHALAQNIGMIQQLTVLRFESNDLGDIGAEMLAQYLPCLSQLEVLALSDNRITDQGAAVLAESISSLKNLKKLEIGGNDFAEAGASALSKNLGSPSELLYLGLDSAGGCAAVAMVQEITSMNQIQCLNLKGNGLRDENAKAMFRSVVKLHQLQDLWLEFNRIKGKGAVALAESLRSLHHLRKLGLGYNTIGDVGAVALAQTFSSLRELEDLSFEGNMIGPKGVVAIAHSLAFQNELSALRLEGNMMGTQGAIALADSLWSLRKMQTLEVGYSTVGLPGKEALRQLKAHHSTLQFYVPR